MKKLKIAYLISLLVFIITEIILIPNSDNNIFLIILFQISFFLNSLILPPLMLYSKTKSKKGSFLALCLTLIIITINISTAFVLPTDILASQSVINDFLAGPFISFLTFVLFSKSFETYKNNYKYVFPSILILFTNFILLTLFTIDYSKYKDLPINLALPTINSFYIKLPLLITIIYLISYIANEIYHKLSKINDKNILVVYFKIWDVILLVMMYIVVPSILIYEIVFVGELASFSLFIKTIVLITLFNISTLLIILLVNLNLLKSNNNNNKKDTFLLCILLLLISISFPITVTNTNINTILFPIVEIILLGIIIYKFYNKENN